MGIFDFVKSAGEKLLDSSPGLKAASVLLEQLRRFQLGHDGLKIERDGGTVKISGEVASQEEKEKILLALGNIEGVERVEESLSIATAADANADAGRGQPPVQADASAHFYTVQPGDTLSAIAQKRYGKASLYPRIFEANRPMLSHPDKIYPGQVLRLPAQA